MWDGFELWTFLAGLPLGLLVASIILYISWRKGKKEKRYDERYQSIHHSAKSLSWGVTTGAILIAWMIILIYEGPSLAFFILTGVWCLHMMSYLIGTLIANRKN